jgi:hypothetical protein
MKKAFIISAALCLLGLVPAPTASAVKKQLPPRQKQNPSTQTKASDAQQEKSQSSSAVASENKLPATATAPAPIIVDMPKTASTKPSEQLSPITARFVALIQRTDEAKRGGNFTGLEWDQAAELMSNEDYRTVLSKDLTRQPHLASVLFTIALEAQAKIQLKLAELAKDPNNTIGFLEFGLGAAMTAVGGIATVKGVKDSVAGAAAYKTARGQRDQGTSTSIKQTATDMKDAGLLSAVPTAGAGIVAGLGGSVLMGDALRRWITTQSRHSATLREIHAEQLPVIQSILKFLLPIANKQVIADEDALLF